MNGVEVTKITEGNNTFDVYYQINSGFCSWNLYFNRSEKEDESRRIWLHNKCNASEYIG